MNAKITSGRRRAPLALAAAAGLVGALLVTGTASGAPAAAAPAAAGPTVSKLTFRCEFPFIEDQSVDVSVTMNMPKVAVVGKKTLPRLQVDTVATVNDKTSKGLRAQDAYWVDGFAEAKAIVEMPERPQGLGVTVPAEIVKTKVPPGGPFNITAKAWSPGLQFEKPGRGRFIMDDTLIMKPITRKKDGSLTDLGDDLTVTCKRTAGDNVLAEFNIIESDGEKPSKPGKPEVTDKSGTTVSLRWGAGKDDVGINGYDVFNGDTKVASTYGEETTTTVTGLSPNTAYNLTIKTRDHAHNLSDASDAVSVTTGPDAPETIPPTAPGQPEVTHVGGKWARMKWAPSTDNRGVTAYDIYFKDGPLAATFPGADPEGWVEDLESNKTYTFVVQARDAAGNRSPFSPPVTVNTSQGAPPGCGEFAEAPANMTTRGCVYMAGYSNVTKLNGATVINDPADKPVHTNIAYRTDKNTNELTAAFKFAKPLSSEATFLTFGFMPTTARMELDQVGLGWMKGKYIRGEGYNVTVKTKVNVRIYNAFADGAPLGLGKYCETAKPMDLEMTAKPADYQDILEGGVLTGWATIPGFAGCGQSEDMDRLFIGAISGAKNYLKVRQGPICRPESPNCDPVKPER